MARTKSKKAGLFEDEEFELTPEQEESEQLEEQQETELPEEPPEDLIIEEPVEVVSTDELEHIVDTDPEEDTLSPVEVDSTEEHDTEKAEDDDQPTKSVVVRCSHCLEEVLDMEICPLCGNPLKLSVDQERIGERISDEDLLPSEEYYFEEDDQEYEKLHKGLRDDDEALFGGLTTYNTDHFSPTGSDGNI